MCVCVEGSEEEVSASEGQPEGEESEREGEGEGEGEGEEGGEGEGSEETIPELGGERVVGGEREDEEDPEDPGPSKYVFHCIFCPLCSMSICPLYVNCLH